MLIKIFFAECQDRVNSALTGCLPDVNGVAPRLYQAMNYSVFNGGKRIRPLLAYATAQALNAPLSLCDNAACAVELIHAYSLIHDDLPAMDDDNLRRGKPTCHIAFDEATAILAGDALQALAFEVLVAESNPVSPENKLKMIARLAHASGSSGMAAGQAIDLASVGCRLTLDQLKQMHQHKTGALIAASVQLGALAAGNATEQQLTALENYAECIGLSFQIKDDILDVEGDTATLGKQQGADNAHDKPTYTSILGLEQARKSATEQHERAMAALSIFDNNADTLRNLSAYIIERNR